jgi:hypothetical protein
LPSIEERAENYAVERLSVPAAQGRNVYMLCNDALDAYIKEELTVAYLAGSAQTQKDYTHEA